MYYEQFCKSQCDKIFDSKYDKGAELCSVAIFNINFHHWIQAYLEDGYLTEL